MLKAAVCLVATLIIVLFISLGQNQVNKSKVQEISEVLKHEQAIGNDLRQGLEESAQINEMLIKRLKAERVAVEAYRVKSDALNQDLLQKTEQIRILERDDKEYRNWSAIGLPLGAIGMLNQN